MIDHNARREKEEQAAPGFRGFCRAVDQACARMNGGLAAFAAVLAVVVVVTASIRLPIILADGMPADVAVPQADQ